MAIRTKTSRPRVTCIIQTCAVYTQPGTNSNGTYYTRLYHIFSPLTIPTTGGSWSSVSNESAIEFNNTLTAFTLAGYQYMIVYEQHYGVGKAFAIDNNVFGNKIDCISDINGNVDYYILTTTTVNQTATQDITYGSINWFEYE